MKLKKMMAAIAAGAFLATAVPAVPQATTLGAGSLAAVAQAKAVGGISHAPKAAMPKASTTKPSNGTSAPKSAVSGNGEKYAPSKEANSLQKNAPGSNAQSAAGRGATNQGTSWGNRLRNIGLFAGGMLLGSMLGSMFGMGTGFMADMLGMLMNILLIVVAVKLVLWLISRVRGNRSAGSTGNTYYARREDEYTQPRSDIKIKDITPNKWSGDYDAKSTADRYRNK